MMEDKDLLDNAKNYWDLVNSIDELCEKFIEEKNLYGDDVISALDRVKTEWIKNHTKYSICNDEEEETTKEDISDKI